PGEAEITSHKLLVRAGFIRQLAAGIFSYLPLARRSLTKIENIMREEINAIGGQEITMPVIQPADLWKETRRWYQIDAELGRLKDRGGRDMVLAMTHEEAATELVRKEIQSYRQLPQLIYHIQTKWRDDPRPRAGLIRVREFTMKDSYSLDADWDGLDQQYRAHYQAYFNIFHRCDLPVIAVKADVGMMGGKLAHEFMYLTPAGEDTLLLCDNCGYAANRQVATFQKELAMKEAPLAREKVATPDCKTIEELSKFLGVPKSKTAKAVFMVATLQDQEASGLDLSHEDERFIFAIVRGDMEVNETKLANAVKARSLRPATDEEIYAIGAEPGYASPVGLHESSHSGQKLIVVVDEAIPDSPNLVAGANQAGFHLRNVNYGRDYQADVVADVAAAQQGDRCPECGEPMQASRGVEVANIFQLGTRYSESMGATFLDRNGEQKPVIMGSYGIGSGRLLASIAEQHHDEQGLIWPITVAPYHVYLVLLAGKDRDVMIVSAAEKLYGDLLAAGVEVLFDDRDESPGVKFNDADLIGLPIRLTVSKRSLKNGGVELKLRHHDQSRVLPLEEAVLQVTEVMQDLQAQIMEQVRPMPYED
ncbi:MAG: proline--tRNA ligase, partial [Anaerolineales bacterium]